MYESMQIRALGHIITSSNQKFSTVSAFQVQFITRQRFATRFRNLLFDAKISTDAAVAHIKCYHVTHIASFGELYFMDPHCNTWSDKLDRVNE